MYACLHVPATHASGEDFLRLALEFSPVVEKTSTETVVFSIAALRKLIGSPHQIASEICRLGYECNLKANLAIFAVQASLRAESFSVVVTDIPQWRLIRLGRVTVFVQALRLQIQGIFSADGYLVGRDHPTCLELVRPWGSFRSHNMRWEREASSLQRLPFVKPAKKRENEDSIRGV